MPRVTKVQSPKLFEAVAAQLREQIVGGELHPGDKLRETDLAEQFGVSRGPIREALRELAREGLVVDLPRRGTLVSAATLGDLLELYDIRQALEVFAVELAIKRATPEDIERVVELYDISERAGKSKSGSYDSKTAADLAFHLEIFRIAGNHRMIAQCEQLFSQTAMLVRSTMRMNPTLELSPPDVVHKSIRDAIEARETWSARARPSPPTTGTRGSACSRSPRETSRRLSTSVTLSHRALPRVAVRCPRPERRPRAAADGPLGPARGFVGEFLRIRGLLTVDMGLPSRHAQMTAVVSHCEYC